MVEREKEDGDTDADKSGVAEELVQERCMGEGLAGHRRATMGGVPVPMMISAGASMMEKHQMAKSATLERASAFRPSQGTPKLTDPHRS